MKIRNPHEVRHLVPALAIEAEPGEEVRVPADSPVPNGWEIADEARRPRSKTSAAGEAADDSKEND